jgi:flagellar basal body-associated protein FliL
MSAYNQEQVEAQMENVIHQLNDGDPKTRVVIVKLKYKPNGEPHLTIVSNCGDPDYVPAILSAAMQILDKKL